MAPAVSFNPNTFVEGGLIDDIDVEFAEIAFCAYDYNGSVPEPTLALGIKLRYADPDKPGEFKDQEQYYSAGDLANFLPSADGFELIPQTTKSALNTNSNAAKFFVSLQQAAQGALDDILSSGSVKGLLGLKVHMKREAQPKRSGIVRTGKNANREQTILLVTKILAMPGQVAVPQPKTGLGGTKVGVGSAKPATATTAKPGPVAVPVPVQAPAAAAPTNGASDVDSLTSEVLLALLLENGGTMAKKDLALKAFRHSSLGNNASKGAVVKRINEDSFLSSIEGITFDGMNVSIAAA